MQYAHVGSISTGTLRCGDLLDTFSSELAYHIGRNKPEIDEETLIDWASLIHHAENMTGESDDALELVNDLQEALDYFTPPYCYFGSHEGDGADFGYWPCMDQIEELPKVSDPSEVEQHLGEDCCFVNDHGNVTVYDAAGKPVLELV